MAIEGFRARMLSGTPLAGTFLKTPAYELVEVLAGAGIDFIALDGEHAPFDRGRMDACLAMSRALDFPVLVRVASGAPQAILQALDSGAVGIVVPHVDSPGKAREIARASRFGDRGRGFAGATRWAGFGLKGRAEILRRSQEETIVIAQIEEPAAVDCVEEIAATEGIDGLFVGPSDLSVAYGVGGMDAPEMVAAFARVGAAARASGKALMTFIAEAAAARDLVRFGVTAFFIASEQSWMRAHGAEQAAVIHAIDRD